MRKILVGSVAMAAVVGLVLLNGCDGKKQAKATAAPAPSVAQAKTERFTERYITSARAIPGTMNPDWERGTNTQQTSVASMRTQPAAEVMVAQTTAIEPVKSAYRMHHEVRNAGITPQPAAQARVYPAAQSRTRATAEIDSDLISYAARPANSGLGYTGDAATPFEPECPELGRDLDAPKFSFNNRKPAAKPVARANVTRAATPAGAATQNLDAPEIGWVTARELPRY